MIKYKRNCKACQLSKQDKAFKTRTYDAEFNRLLTGESYSSVAADYKGVVSLPAISNHCRKHLRENNKLAPAIIINKVEKARAVLQETVERSVDHDSVLAVQDFENTWDTVITTGMDELRKGNMKVSVNQLLAATKLKSEFQMKKRGQDTEVIKMMMRAASGQ